MWLPSSQEIAYWWPLGVKCWTWERSVVIQHVIFCFNGWARTVIAVILATLHHLSQHANSGEPEGNDIIITPLLMDTLPKGICQALRDVVLSSSSLWNSFGTLNWVNQQIITPGIIKIYHHIKCDSPLTSVTEKTKNRCLSICFLAHNPIGFPIVQLAQLLPATLAVGDLTGLTHIEQYFSISFTFS